MDTRDGTMAMTELKPCPFCGGETKIRTYSGMGRTMFFVQCNDCAAESSCYDTKEEAVAAWNRRDGERHGDE